MANQHRSESRPAVRAQAHAAAPTAHRVLILFLVLVFLNGLVAMSVFGQGTDNIRKLDGTIVSGKMVNMTADGVTLEVRRSPTTVATQEIDRLTFFDEPRRTNAAREYLDNQQYQQAVKELSAMREDWSKARTVTALDGLYLLATGKAELALAGIEGHSLSDAVSMVREFRERGKEHYRYYPATLLYARLGKAANRLDLAEQEYASLTDVKDRKVALEANLQLGFLQMIQNNYDGASQSFEKVQALDIADTDSLKKKTVAQLYLMAARAGTGDAAAEARNMDAKIKELSADDYYVNAYAYNALGLIHLINKEPKKAEVAFLHTDLLYAANNEAHAEALYHLVQLWNQMGKADRVTEGRDKLMNRYGGSFWTAKLNER